MKQIDHEQNKFTKRRQWAWRLFQYFLRYSAATLMIAIPSIANANPGVSRDIFYSGNELIEYCSISPTFVMGYIIRIFDAGAYLPRNTKKSIAHHITSQASNFRTFFASICRTTPLKGITSQTICYRQRSNKHFRANEPLERLLGDADK